MSNAGPTPRGTAEPDPHTSSSVRSAGRTWVRQLLIVLLAINSGAIDAIGFIALGGAFSSVMTGNMVLIGISAAHADGALARTAVLSLVCFIVGCAVGARIAGKARTGDGIWPAPIRQALIVELLLVIGVLVGWELTGPDRSGAAPLAMLGANALALGVQSSAMQRFGVAGLSTTYLTGTLTTVVSRLALREPVRRVGPSAAILAGLIVGAFLGALLAIHANAWAPVLPLVLVAAAVTVPILVWKGAR